MLIFVKQSSYLLHLTLLPDKNRRNHLKFKKCLAKFEIRSQIPLHSVLQSRCSIDIAFSSVVHGVATIPQSKDFHALLSSSAILK